jgi:hypothetical protein
LSGDGKAEPFGLKKEMRTQNYSKLMQKEEKFQIPFGDPKGRNISSFDGLARMSKN